MGGPLMTVENSWRHIPDQELQILAEEAYEKVYQKIRDEESVLWDKFVLIRNSEKFSEYSRENPHQEYENCFKILHSLIEKYRDEKSREIEKSMTKMSLLFGSAAYFRFLVKKSSE
jgi:hypothetical protein